MTEALTLDLSLCPIDLFKLPFEQGIAEALGKRGFGVNSAVQECVHHTALQALQFACLVSYRHSAEQRSSCSQAANSTD